MEAEGTTIMACFDEPTQNKSFAHLEPSKIHSADDSAPPASACFDCSICLDFAAEPVVTLCGHLYCWPCIYKWLQVETAAPQQCPVCKSPLSLNALVPLYGRGGGIPSTKARCLDIPNRPAVPRAAISSVIEDQYDDGYIGLNRPMQQRQQQHVHQHHHHHYHPSPWGTAGGVLGGLAIAILPLVMRNNQSAVEMYSSRLNHLMPPVNSTSQRLQERRVEDSLHQIWVFLFCCALLGLLFF